MQSRLYGLPILTHLFNSPLALLNQLMPSLKNGRGRIAKNKQDYIQQSSF